MPKLLQDSPDPLARRFSFPKWNRSVTVLDEPSLFSRLPEFADWTRDRHLAAAIDYLSIATVTSRMHAQIVRTGEDSFGTDGALISGGFRDHWPSATKDAIRTLAQASSDQVDRSLAHWRASGRTVQTWRAKRDACRYGGSR